MRTIEEMIKRAKEAGFEVTRQDIDGCMFANMKQKQTIICSWGGGWEHVSINRWDRDPLWAEMCDLKEMFWGDNEWAVQYHPAQSEYVNNAVHCLHLWKPIEKFAGKLPTPPSAFVGIKGFKLK